MVRGTDASLYWPLRVGGGFMYGINRGAVYIEARGDVFGLALQVGQVMGRLSRALPPRAWTPDPLERTDSSTSNSTIILHRFGGVGVSYMF